MSPLTESVPHSKTLKYMAQSSGSCCDKQPNVCGEQLPENNPLRNEMVELTQDIARHIMGLSAKRLSSGVYQHATTMRRVVDDVMARHSILFNGMVRRLALSNGDDVVASFQTVVAEMCADGVNNWGRMASVFAFAGRIVRHCTEVGIISVDRPESVDAMACSLGNRIADALGCWVRDNGGWDQFEAFFTPHSHTAESMLWRAGLITAAIGLGAVAAVIAVR